jgi:hypothetical protein
LTTPYRDGIESFQEQAAKGDAAASADDAITSGDRVTGAFVRSPDRFSSTDYSDA